MRISFLRSKWTGSCGCVAFAALTCVSPASGAQAPTRPRKVPTPEQVTYQAASAKWLEQYDSLRTKIREAYAAELARARAGDCPDADTTLAEEQCLSKEMATTQANYATVTSALRATLGLVHPSMPGEAPVAGPQGTPLTEAERVAEFDRLEAASNSYRKLAEKAAFDSYKGGTLAPVAAAEADQKLLRSHLEELAFVYETEFSTR